MPNVSLDATNGNAGFRGETLTPQRWRWAFFVLFVVFPLCNPVRVHLPKWSCLSALPGFSATLACTPMNCATC